MEMCVGDAGNDEVALHILDDGAGDLAPRLSLLIEGDDPAVGGGEFLGPRMLG